IRISKGSNIIHRWYIHLIPHEMTIKDFFIKLTTGKLSSECNIDIIDPETIKRIDISKTQNTAAIQVSPNCNIIEVTTNNAHRTKLYFPNFSQLEKSNRKLNLHSDIVDWIQHHGREWSTQSYTDTQEKQFVTYLTETIWYIDMHDHKKLKD
ncbi:33321_t:CDS:2, partial [Racocetra persica]